MRPLSSSPESGGPSSWSVDHTARPWDEHLTASFSLREAHTVIETRVAREDLALVTEQQVDVSRCLDYHSGSRQVLHFLPGEDVKKATPRPMECP